MRPLKGLLVRTCTAIRVSLQSTDTVTKGFTVEIVVGRLSVHGSGARLPTVVAGAGFVAIYVVSREIVYRGILRGLEDDRKRIRDRTRAF